MKTSMMLAVALALASGCDKEKATEGAGSAAGTARSTQGSAASNGSATGTDGIKLGVKSPAVGDKRTVEETLTTTFTLTPEGKEPIDAKSEKTQNKRFEVLAVDGTKLQKVKVEYTAMTERDRVGTKTRDKPNPLHGKVYIVWREAGAIRATDGEGKPVSPEEAKALEDEWKNDLDGDDVMEKWFRDRTWKIGEKVTLTAEQLAELHKKNPNTSATSGSMALTRVERDIATFEVVMDVRQRNGDDTLTMPMTVTAMIDTRTSWPRQLQMEGTLEGPMKGLQAKGSLVGTTTYTYESSTP